MAIPALGYLRTSSQSNVGEDKDSEPRQRAAIAAGAARHGYEIVDWYYDAGVTGDMPVTDRPGFNAMLDRIDGNHVRTVFVENADRFARKMLTAELGILLLVSRNVQLFTASGEDLTNTDDEMRVAFRQMAMTFAQLEKTRLVKKLRQARDRKSAAAGRRIEGQKGYQGHRPEVFPALAELRQQNPKATLQQLADGLAQQGILTATGKPLAPNQVRRLVLRLDGQEAA